MHCIPSGNGFELQFILHFEHILGKISKHFYCLMKIRENKMQQKVLAKSCEKMFLILTRDGVMYQAAREIV